jgi:hypothetical protein
MRFDSASLHRLTEQIMERIWFIEAPQRLWSETRVYSLYYHLFYTISLCSLHMDLKDYLDRCLWPARLQCPVVAHGSLWWGCQWLWSGEPRPSVGVNPGLEQAAMETWAQSSCLNFPSSVFVWYTPSCNPGMRAGRLDLRFKYLRTAGDI